MIITFIIILIIITIIIQIILTIVIARDLRTARRVSHLNTRTVFISTIILHFSIYGSAPWQSDTTKPNRCKCFR